MIIRLHDWTPSGTRKHDGHVDWIDEIDLPAVLLSDDCGVDTPSCALREWVTTSHASRLALVARFATFTPVK